MCEEGLFTKNWTGGRKDSKVRGQLWNKPSPRGVGYLARGLKYRIIEFLTDIDNVSNKKSQGLDVLSHTADYEHYFYSCQWSVWSVIFITDHRYSEEGVFDYHNSCHTMPFFPPYFAIILVQTISDLYSFFVYILYEDNFYFTGWLQISFERLLNHFAYMYLKVNMTDYAKITDCFSCLLVGFLSFEITQSDSFSGVYIKYPFQ